MELHFVVPGRPLSWKRTNAHGGRKLTPAKQRAYQRRIRLAAAIGLRGLGWSAGGRYAVEVVAYMPDLKRCDLDNVAKNALDAMQPLVFADDSQVDALAVVRRLDRERPRVEVTVVPVEVGEPVEVEIRVGRCA